MEIDTGKLFRISVPVLEGFSRIEPRKWGLDGILLELATEIGSLGRNLTIWEGYRYGRKSRHKMADELSDIFLMLVRLCLELGITPKAKLFAGTAAESPEGMFFSLLQSCSEMQKRAEAVNPNKIAMAARIEGMMTLVGMLAEHYGISLEEAHEEEMDLASHWQRLFFTSEGRKRGSIALLPRKLVLGVIALLHQRRLDR